MTANNHPIKISILIPIYNSEQYINRCAISLFEQTYELIEYIFVNDCSKDKSIDILKETINSYPKRKDQTFIINHISNQGSSAARNTALKHSTGKYIMYVDADDYIEKDTIEKCVKNISDVDILFFGSRHICKNRIYIENYNELYNIQKFIIDILLRKSSVSLWGGLYKRNLFIDNQISLIEGLFMGDDYVTKPRLLYYAKKISFLNEPLYNYIHYEDRDIRCSDIIDLSKSISTLKHFFQTKTDYNIYKEALYKAETLAKITLLIHWSKSNVENELVDIILDLFPDANNYKHIDFNKKIILFLTSKKYYFLLKHYLLIGMKIKTYLK